MSDSEDTSPAGDQSSGRGEPSPPGHSVNNVDDDVPQLEGQDDMGPAETGTELTTNRRHDAVRDQPEDGSEVSSMDASLVDPVPRRAGSPVDSVMSGLGDSPSVHVRRAPTYLVRRQANMDEGSFMSSPGSSILPSVASRAGLNSPTPSFRPFDRRFQSRISSGPNSPRASSPAFLSTHSRNVSLGSNFILDQTESDTPTAPWEVVRWTRLKKLNGHAFSEAGRRNFGSPTCLAVSASIVLGTSKGIILMFDYSQNLKMIIGQGTKGEYQGLADYSSTTDSSSRRIWTRYGDCYFCGSYDHRWRPCQRQYLYLGYVQGRPTLSHHPPPG